MRSLASVAYVVLGVLVASQHDYYAHLTTVSQVVSAVVAFCALAAYPVRSEPSSQPSAAVFVESTRSDGFYNMGTLASSFERKYNSEPDAQFELGSVKCYMTGAHTAWCWGRLTAGRYHGRT